LRQLSVTTQTPTLCRCFPIGKLEISYTLRVSALEYADNLNLGRREHLNVRVARAESHHNVAPDLAINLFTPLPLLLGLLLIEIPMLSTVVSPIYRVYSGFGSNRVIAS